MLSAERMNKSRAMFAHKQIGRELMRERASRGHSQEAFASNIGMHRTYYSAIERGEKNLTFLTFLRICRGLNINPSTILKEAGY